MTREEAVLYYSPAESAEEQYRLFIQKEKTWCVKTPLVPILWFKRLKTLTLYHQAAVMLDFETSQELPNSLMDSVIKDSHSVLEWLVNYNALKAVRQQEIFLSKSISELLCSMRQWLYDFRTFSRPWIDMHEETHQVLLSREPDAMVIFEIARSFPSLTFTTFKEMRHKLPIEFIIESSRLFRLHQQFESIDIQRLFLDRK